MKRLLLLSALALIIAGYKPWKGDELPKPVSDEVAGIYKTEPLPDYMVRIKRDSEGNRLDYTV